MLLSAYVHSIVPLSPWFLHADNFFSFAVLASRGIWLSKPTLLATKTKSLLQTICSRTPTTPTIYKFLIS